MVKLLIGILKMTEASAADHALFCFLVAITLGIYLPWSVCLANCISSDPGSFYCRTLNAKENSCQNHPELVPPADEDDGPSLSKLTEMADAVLELSIPDENPLKDLCGELFEDFSKPIDGIAFNAFLCVESPYEFFKKCVTKLIWNPAVRYRNGTIAHLRKLRVSGGIDSALIRNFSIICSSDNYEDDIPKLKTNASTETWNAFIIKLLQLYEYATPANRIKCCRFTKGKYVNEALAKNFSNTYSMCSAVNTLANKAVRKFQQAFYDAVAQQPLNKFFSLPQSSRREQIPIIVVRQGIEWILANLNKSKLWSPKTCLKSLQNRECLSDDCSSKSVGDLCIASSKKCAVTWRQRS
jgi:hypothetical protein